MAGGQSTDVRQVVRNHTVSGLCPTATVPARPPLTAFRGRRRVSSRALVERIMLALALPRSVLLPLSTTLLAEVFGTVVERIGVQWALEAPAG